MFEERSKRGKTSDHDREAELERHYSGDYLSVRPQFYWDDEASSVHLLQTLILVLSQLSLSLVVWYTLYCRIMAAAETLSSISSVHCKSKVILDLQGPGHENCEDAQFLHLVHLQFP